MLMCDDCFWFVVFGIGCFEDLGDLWVFEWYVVFVCYEVLFGDIGDIFCFVIFCQEMVEWLFVCWLYVCWNGILLFFGIGIFGVDIKDYVVEGKDLMVYNLINLIFCDILFYCYIFFIGIFGVNFLKCKRGGVVGRLYLICMLYFNLDCG